jgi:aminoglycoside phosphotransferase (APT) family kinase protein
MSSAASAATPAANPVEVLRGQLERLLNVEVRDLRRLTGGASRETWSFNSVTHHDGLEIVRALICRRDPVYGARVGGMPLEARLFAAAERAGVPVPLLIASGDASPDELDTGYLVMEHVAGETIARKILRDEPYVHARSVLVAQMGSALAKLHSLPVDSVSGLDLVDPLQKYRDVLDKSAGTH